MAASMKPEILLVFLTLTLLAGCGIKPNDVSAPPGTSKDGFPHTYPKPETAPP